MSAFTGCGRTSLSIVVNVIRWERTDCFRMVVHVLRFFLQNVAVSKSRHRLFFYPKIKERVKRTMNSSNGSCTIKQTSSGSVATLTTMDDDNSPYPVNVDIVGKYYA